MLELELEPDLLTRSLSPMEYLHKLSEADELFDAFPFSFTYLLALDLPLGSSGLLPFRLPFLRSLLSPEVRIVDNVILIFLFYSPAPTIFGALAPPQVCSFSRGYPTSRAGAG